MLNAQVLANTGVSFLQPNSLVTTESFHPYGNTPEDSLWSEPCLAASINLFPAAPSAFQPCNLFGNAGGNAAQAVQYSLVQQSRNTTLRSSRLLRDLLGNTYDRLIKHGAKNLDPGRAHMLHSGESGILAGRPRFQDEHHPV